VDATSLASGDKSLSANAKTLLRRLFEAEAEKAAKDAESAAKERRMNAHASTSKKPMATTTGAAKISGAITAQHLATSVAGIMLFQVLSGM